MAENVSDALKNAFLQSSLPTEGKIAVKAEDVQNEGSGINFKEHFFEPEVGSDYTIKFLPNPGGENLTHRSVYKNLPDPERKGKTFHYVSSGVSKTCKALELFFELNALKKEGDAIADKKIDKYMGKTNQGCVKIQILSSPKQEEIGMIRLFTFATFGPNATVANLIDQKLNPTEKMIKDGEEREDIYNIFSSPVMNLSCIEATYDGNKGRDFTKSTWLKKNRGAIVKLESGETHEFKEKDVENGEIVKAIVPFFEEFVKQVTDEKYDVYKYFAYKKVDDERNDKDTNDYLKKVFAKVDEIIPIIRDKSLSEIAAYGKKDTSAANGEGKEDKAKNIMAESIPDELAGSVMKDEEQKVDEKKTEAPKKDEEAPKTENADEVEDILNS